MLSRTARRGALGRDAFQGTRPATRENLRLLRSNRGKRAPVNAKVDMRPILLFLLLLPLATCGLFADKETRTLRK